MKIILNNEFYIEKLDIGYGLVQLKLSKGNADNKTAVPRLVKKTVGYYMTVPAAVRSFVQKWIDKESADFSGDLKGYEKRLTDITNACAETVMKGVEKVL